MRLPMRFWGAACVLAAALIALPAEAKDPGFHRGVNLSHWLQYDGRQPIRTEDVQSIAGAGFDHVRLPFDPVRLGWQPLTADPGAPLAKVDQLDDAVTMILAANLGVIVDFHPEADIKELIEGKPAARAAYLNLWKYLAARYAPKSLDKVAFEVLNEPQYYGRGATAWNNLQKQAVATIRAVAPRNLLLLSGIRGSDIDALERTEVINDPNACYVFHFYDPQLVTHLGADWDPYPSRAQGMMRGLIYPATDMAMGKVQFTPKARPSIVGEAVRKYLNEGWNYDRIVERIDIAKEWAASAGVCLRATEFGALRGTLENSSRLRWMGDVRRALESADIGWTLWDYADIFGIATAQGDVERLNSETTMPAKTGRFTRTLDPIALVVLGLAR